MKVNFKETVVFSIVLEPNRNSSHHWFVSAAFSFKVGPMNPHLPQEHKEGQGSPRWLRREPPPQTQTNPPAQRFQNTGIWVAPKESSWFELQEIFIHRESSQEGRNPTEEKYIRPFMKSVIKTSESPYYVLGAILITGSQKETWLLPSGGLQPSEIVFSWSTSYRPDIRLGPVQTLSH